MRSSAGYSMVNILKAFEDRMKVYKQNLFIDENTFKFYTYSWRIEEYIFNQLYDLDEKDLEDYINYIYDNVFDLVNYVFSLDMYSNVLNSLDENEKEYILQRNDAFCKHKLYEYIVKVRKSNKFFKLTPPIIYYGK